MLVGALLLAYHNVLFPTFLSHGLLVRKPLGRPRRRWIDDIKMGLLRMGLGGVDWIGTAQDRYRWRALINAVMNLWVPENAGNLASGYITCGLSSGTQLHRVS
jgi:hypothetical protein